MKCTKASLLSRHFGGTWTYHGMRGWWCDDGERFVCYVSNGVDKFDNLLTGPSRCYMYGAGTPIRIDWAELEGGAG